MKKFLTSEWSLEQTNLISVKFLIAKLIIYSRGQLQMYIPFTRLGGATDTFNSVARM